MGAMQVELVSLLSQCMVDAARWEDGLKACENTMSVLPSATHLPLSQWKVGKVLHGMHMSSTDVDTLALVTVGSPSLLVIRS